MRMLLAMWLVVVSLWGNCVALAEELKVVEADYTLVMGDNDTRFDARKQCGLIVKRMLVERAGVFIQSHSKVDMGALDADEVDVYATANLRDLKTVEERFGIEGQSQTLYMKMQGCVDTAGMDERIEKIKQDDGLRAEAKEQRERLAALQQNLAALQEKLNAQDAHRKYTDDQIKTLRQQRQATLDQAVDTSAAQDALVLCRLTNVAKQGIIADLLKDMGWEGLAIGEEECRMLLSHHLGTLLRAAGGRQ